MKTAEEARLNFKCLLFLSPAVTSGTHPPPTHRPDLDIVAGVTLRLFNFARDLKRLAFTERRDCFLFLSFSLLSGGEAELSREVNAHMSSF